VLFAQQEQKVGSLLLHMGADINAQTKGDLWTPLHCAVAAGSFSGVLFCLQQENVSPWLRDNYERTPLHTADQLERRDILNLLLQCVYCKKVIDARDIFGRRALDYAIEAGCDEAIALLSGEEWVSFSDVKGYDRPAPVIAQDKIIAQFLRYKEIFQFSLEEILGKGLCNGFVFLFSWYSSQHKSSIFFHILETIASWDGSVDGLRDKVSQSLVLEGYSNVNEIFLQMINDLLFFQNDADLSSVTQLTQEDRRGQLVLISERKLQHCYLQKFSGITCSQLLENLYIYSWDIGSYIEIGSVEHVTVVHVAGHDRWHYFDPNFPYACVPISNIEQLVRLIQNTHDFCLKDSLLTDVCELLKYRFHDTKGFRKTSERLAYFHQRYKQIFRGTSPCRYTQLHRALLLGDIKFFECCLFHKNADINAKDAFDRTPLHLAILTKNREACEMLFQEENLDYSGALCVAIQAKWYEMLERLLEKGIDLNLDTSIAGFAKTKPLIWAVFCDDLKAVQILLRKKPKLNVADEFYSLFHRIFYCDEVVRDQIAEAIIAAMPNLFLFDPFGYSICYYAKHLGSESVMRMIGEKGEER